MNIKIKFAENKKDFLNAKLLFKEYSDSLDFSLSFQGFDEELKKIPGKYATPEGCIILALNNSYTIGCIAMRPLDKYTCEIKHLFLKPSFRGLGLGKVLTKKIIEYSKKIKYSKILLDTTTKMRSAIRIYRSLGFLETSPYYTNPLPDVLYFELDINKQ